MSIALWMKPDLTSIDNAINRMVEQPELCPGSIPAEQSEWQYNITIVNNYNLTTNQIKQQLHAQLDAAMWQHRTTIHLVQC
jgi:hypothetical protein